MVTFSVFTKHPSLHARRLLHTARIVSASVCAGLAAALALSGVTALVSKAEVVTASTAIARGSVIAAVDVQLVKVPSTIAEQGMVRSLDDVVGKVAQIDIGEGEPVTTHMARDSPTVPSGFTVVDVLLASTSDGLVVGDEVKLIAAVGCEDALCTLAQKAVVMATDRGEQHLTSLAMLPKEALAVMNAQEMASIVAILTDD